MNKLNSRIHPKTKRPLKVMQFGEGNFLRAFVDWIIQTMNEENNFDANVVVVQPLPQGRVSDLESQDGLYTLLLEGVLNGEIKKTNKIIDCLDDFINPYLEYEKYLSYAKSEDLKYIISNTTEAGIVLDSSDTDLSKTPNSFPGKLLALLKARYDHFDNNQDKGLHIIPCELIDYNGDELKKTLIELAKINQFDDHFINWLCNDNYYYNTLVDRIVPGYPKNRIKELETQLGYLDNSIVMGEIFHLWVIEDKEKRLKNDFKNNLNVKFVDDFVPYKERKVKILNGSHTLMTPIGYLANLDTVKEAVNDEVLGTFIKEFIFEEVIPTIKLPFDDMVSFANSVLERYQNPFIDHQLLSIALNSFTKYKTRILPTILENINHLNVFPRRALFALAALIVFYRGYRNEEKIELFDNKEFLELMADLWNQYDQNKISLSNLTTTVLGLKSHWGLDLNDIEQVSNFVTKSIADILENGMIKAIKQI